MRIGIVLVSLLFSFMAHSQEVKYSRTIQLEWEEVEGATGYDVEVSSEEQKSEVFKVTEPNWSGQLHPGKYVMRIRSRDHRKVPGSWSEPTDFSVGLEVPKTTAPPLQEVQAQKDQEVVKLSWEATPLAQKYKVHIQSEDKSYDVTHETLKPELEIELAAARSYSWTVQAILNEEIQSEISPEQKLTLVGPPLPTPVIEEPKNEYVRVLNWKAVGDYYVLVLRQWDPNTQKWIPFKKMKVTENSLPFASDWPGGKYILVIQPHAKLRPPAPQARMKFSVRSGDRSPAAEQMELVNKPVVYTSSGWFFSSGFSVNSLDYKNSNAETNAFTRYKVNGSLIRLTAGYDTSESLWGFSSHYELASYLFEGNGHHFHNLSAHSTYKIVNGSWVQLKLNMGGYMRETPESVSSFSNSNISDSKHNHLGLLLGTELGFSFTSRLGLKMRLTTYLPMGTITSPNGQNSYSHLGHEAGWQAYYKVNRELTTSFGMSHREETYSYPINPGSVSGSSNGNINQSDLKNTSFGLTAEWSF